MKAFEAKIWVIIIGASLMVIIFSLAEADASGYGRTTNITNNYGDTNITNGMSDGDIASMFAMTGALQGIHFDKSTRAVQQGVGVAYFQDGGTDSFGVAYGFGVVPEGEAYLVSLEATVNVDSGDSNDDVGDAFMLVGGINW